MGFSIKGIPSTIDVFRYKSEHETIDKYKDEADKFIDAMIISKYADVDEELSIGDDTLWGALSNNTVLITDGENVKQLSIDELADKYKNAGGMLVRNIYDSLMFELYQSLYLTDSNKEEEYRLSNYGDIESYMHRYKCIAAESKVVEVINNFTAKHIALPISLIEEYMCIIDAVETNDAQNKVKTSIGDAYEYFWNSDAYICALCKDNTEYSNITELGYSFAKMTKYLAEHGLKNIRAVENLINATSKEIMCVRVGDTERLATVKEIKSLVSGVYKKRVYCLDDYKISMMCAVWWMISGDSKYARFAHLDKLDNGIMEICANLEFLKKSVAWMMSEQFMKEDVPGIISGSKETVYPTEVSDDMKIETDLKITKMLKVVKENVDRADSYGALCYDIATKALKDKQHKLTEKQLVIITRQYEKINGKKDEDKISDEIKGIINELESKYKNKQSDIVRSIIEYIDEHKFCSPKQEKVLRDTICKYRQAENADSNKAKGNGTRQYEKSVGGVKQSDLSINNAAKIFGISFDAADISNTLGKAGANNV